MKKVFSLLLLFTIISTNVFALNDKDSMILVNATHPISEIDAPDQTINIADYVKSTKTSILMQPTAAENYIKMVKDMADSGLNLLAVSGYRTYSYQKVLFNNKIKDYSYLGSEEAYDVAKTIVAIPGTSEHQTGLAIDVSSDGSLEEDFSATAEGKWIKENAHKYGFIVRYPDGKQDITKIIFEPWHIRYVGFPHAEIMYSKKICMEEYFDLLISTDYIYFEKDGKNYTVNYQEKYDDSDDVISISATNFGGFVVTREFNDPLKMVKGTWAEDAVSEAYNAGFISGDKYIIPSDYISREDFVKLFSGYISDNIIRDYTGFSDVNPDSKNYNLIVKAYETGMINGFGDTFEPQGAITRQQASVIISRLLGLEEITLINFTDMDTISGWAFQDVQKVYKSGIITGYTDGSFKPNNHITLAEAATMLKKISK